MRSLVDVRNGSPDLVVGKSGITQEVIDEIKVRIKKHKIIKVKMLAINTDVADKKELAKEIALRADADLVSRVGFVLILKDPKINL